MKKRIMIVLVPFIILIVLLAVFYQNEYGVRSKIEISDNITLEIKEGTLKSNEATLILTNNTDQEYTYGDGYFIEEEHYGKWFKTKQVHEVGVLGYGITLKPKEKVELNANWEYEYGNLKDGKYRIVYDFSQENYTKKIYAAAEFVIVLKETN